MVSNARLDLPEPDSPVTTTMRSRGSSTETLRRLCTRAPCTEIVVRGPPCDWTRLAGIAFPGVEEGQFLDGDVASLGQENRRRRLADEAEVCEVLARGGDAADPGVLAEMILDVAAGADVSELPEIVDDG